MEISKLVEVLKATLDENEREQAEQQLIEVQKVMGFAPVLLQVVMSGQIEMPVRQAGIIYLKNFLTHNWMERKPTCVTDPMPFCIFEQDKIPIRENVIEAIIHAPEPVRVQLCVCLSHIIKSDYPAKWPNAVDKMVMYLNSDNHETWMGALLSIYNFVKVYEYKPIEERQVMEGTMAHVLPVLLQRLTQMTAKVSDPSFLLQKQILKIFYAYTQNYLPLTIFNSEFFTQWMEAIRRIVDKDIPAGTNEQVGEEERPQLPCWKLRKWGVNILSRMFEKYGSPGFTTKRYDKFSKWYLKAFTGGVMKVLLKILDQYRQGVYVSPRVVLLCLSYLNTGVNHTVSWQLIKPHMQNLIQGVIFPLMCHNDVDEDLWNTDPIEYVRSKYDTNEDFYSPMIAAQILFHSAVAKRKEMLNKAMGFSMAILTDCNAEPRKRDGAFQMIGAVADILLKRKIYQDQAEGLLTTHVFPAFHSEFGFLRARACWVIHSFADLRFSVDENLMTILELVRNALCNDKDIPVRVEAAIALRMFISDDSRDKRVEAYLKPHIKQVIMELLHVIRVTENDELTEVIESLVCSFEEEVKPIAQEMVAHLAETFAQITGSTRERVATRRYSEGKEEKAATALGIITALDTILDAMQSHREIIIELESSVLPVISIALQSKVIDFYEEGLGLIESLTSTQISPTMWKVFDMIYRLFESDGIEYFQFMTPSLHNYVTVDTEAFISNPANLEALFNMCRSVLLSGLDEGKEVLAVKLLEVVLVQAPGKVDHVLTSFMELIFTRLTRKFENPELRYLCLQVVVAGVYYNASLLFDILNKLSIPNVTGSILKHFIQEWIPNVDRFPGVHTRKVCVLGLCSLINMAGQRPQEINDIAPQILPACLQHFQSLKRAYFVKAREEENGSSEEDDDDSESDLDSGDEDDMEMENSSDEDDDEDSIDGTDYDLDAFTTWLDDKKSPVDEYCVFKDILTNLPNQDAGWYQLLCSNLTESQTTEVQDIFKLAEQRRAVKDSSKIEEGGGYNFAQSRQVPSTFNFGP